MTNRDGLRCAEGACRVLRLLACLEGTPSGYGEPAAGGTSVVDALECANGRRRLGPRFGCTAGARGGSGDDGAAGVMACGRGSGTRRERCGGSDHASDVWPMARALCTPPSSAKIAARRARPRCRSRDRGAGARGAGAGPCAGARRQGAPREGEVGHGGEARLVRAQREQEVGDAVAPRAGRRRGRARTSSTRAGRRAATSSAPASPTSHVPSAPRSSTRPVRRVQLARVVADEVAEQPERRALGGLAAPRGRGRTTFAPRWA